MKIACLDYPSVQGTPREAYLDVSPGASGYDVQGVQQNAPAGNTSPARTSPADMNAIMAAMTGGSGGNTQSTNQTQ